MTLMKRVLRLLLAMPLTACGGGGGGGNNAALLEEEARGIPWELLSGKIVYARWENPTSPGNEHGRIFLIDVAARKIRLIYDVPIVNPAPSFESFGWVRDLAIHPDGTSVTFAARDPAHGTWWELHDLSLSDGTQRLLYPEANAHHLYPSWSRDGQLAYVSSADVRKTVDVDGTGRIEGSNDSRVAWTGSGTMFVSLVDPNSSQGNLYLADPTAQTRRPILVNSQPQWDAEIFDSPALSPDGRKLAYVRWGLGVQEDVWVADADGTNRVRLTTEGAWQPAWSADSREVLFTRLQSGIFLVDTATGTLTQVTQHQADYVAWAP